MNKHVMKMIAPWVIDVRLERSWRTMWIDCLEIALLFAPESKPQQPAMMP